MDPINQARMAISRPERILQYGEGNFLRAFADWQIDILNEKTNFNGNIAAVQPRNREGGMGAAINAQQGLYTTVLRGLSDGKVVEEFRTVRSLSRCINPYTQFDQYIACAKNPDLRFVFSNTTEAGIVYRAGESLEDRPQISFPGKVAALLYRRYEHFRGDPSKALVFLPCELIDKNGAALREIVERHAAEWQLGEDFSRWLKSCLFCNTLVDRIVSGFPGEEAEALWEKLGYRDNLLTAGELFHLWVIEKPKSDTPPWDYQKELPLTEAGLNVIWVDGPATQDGPATLDIYRTRKVRVLNGAHSSTVLAAYLYGLDTVEQCTLDTTVRRFMEQAIFHEIIPSVSPGGKENAAGSTAELNRFARETLERFANPYIKHQLLSIALNSVSKFKTRVLPSILAYREKFHHAPPALCCSLAALLAFYRGIRPEGSEMQGIRPAAGDKKETPYPIRDDPETLRRFAALWAAAGGDSGTGDSSGGANGGGTNPAALQGLVHAALGSADWWGEDLTAYPDIEKAVAESLALIRMDGMAAAFAAALAAGQQAPLTTAAEPAAAGALP